MKYASVNGERREAEPKLLGGTCPNCDREMIAKCGPTRMWHWSHKGKLECDHWWEPETEWHRNWKGLFPKEWQEIIHKAEDGERHIADVKNSNGIVLELQHSRIDPAERLSRERFYGRMVWIVDGRRLKRDLPAFHDALEYGRIVKDKPLTVSSPLMARPAGIFRRWAPIHCPVFVDFGDEEFTIGRLRCPEPVLWQLQLHPRTGEVVVAAAVRESFKRWFGEGGELRHFHVKSEPPPPTRGRYRSRRF